MYIFAGKRFPAQFILILQHVGELLLQFRQVLCVCQEFGKDTFETLHNYNEPNALEIWVLKLHGFRLNCVVYICVFFLSALYCYGKFDWALFSNHLVQIVLLKVHRSVLFQLKCSFSCFCFFNFLRQNPTLQDWFLQEGT